MIVKDTVVNNKKGSFTDWKLTLWGECIDESKAIPLPMPNENDDDDHDATQTVSASTTSISTHGLPTVSVPASVTNHPERPVNAKPTNTNGSSTLPLSTSEPTSNASPSATPENLLPSFFPTFGVSKNTQIWIYGSFAIIVLFCAGIGTYLYLARRRRKRNNVRDDYEFEVLDDRDGEGDTGGFGGRKGGKRRAGELYDAFAEESDEELFSGDDEKYKDEDEDRLEHPEGVDDQAGIERRGLLGPR